MSAGSHPRPEEGGVEHVPEVAEQGKSAATPAILAATWIAIVLPLFAVVVALAFGAAYLVTGSAGTICPAAPTEQATPPISLDRGPADPATGRCRVGRRAATLPSTT